MLSFYPGPSKLDPHIKTYMQQAVDSEILERNHRSPEFVSLSQETVALFKERLNVPSSYEVCFVSSATECWEILSESFAECLSFHVYNGAFGEKWMDKNQVLFNRAVGVAYPIQRRISINHLKKTAARQAELICITQCETSNSTLVSNKVIRSVKKTFPQALVMVDATSSMGGIETDWLAADIWYASVQKCFGLPSGMAVMVCSPKGLEKAYTLGHREHYNSLISTIDQIRLGQTTHTPNILNIYLLNKVLAHRKNIKQESSILKDRFRYFHKKMVKMGWKPLIKYDSIQSPTVVAFLTDQQTLAHLKKSAKAHGILLGNGYGPWKETSFRIANFPSHTHEDFEKLLRFFESIEKNIL